jgi:hypothetical protein
MDYEPRPAAAEQLVLFGVEQGDGRPEVTQGAACKTNEAIDSYPGR